MSKRKVEFKPDARLIGIIVFSIALIILMLSL